MFNYYTAKDHLTPQNCTKTACYDKNGTVKNPSYLQTDMGSGKTLIIAYDA